MQKWIAAAGMAVVSLSGCNAPNILAEKQQPRQVKLTMQEVIPPMVPVNAQEAARQQKFLQKNLGRFKSRKLASKYYVVQAKRTFNEDKLDSAMVYFNHAWLMDSNNNDIYWGYGLVYGQQEEYEKALYILYRALDKDKENPRLLTDVATTHLARFYAYSMPDDLQQSKKLLERALRLDPRDAADAYYKLAVSSYYLREYKQAWRYLHQSILRDKKREDQRFIAVLLEKEHDPEGVYVAP